MKYDVLTLAPARNTGPWAKLTFLERKARLLAEEADAHYAAGRGRFLGRDARAEAEHLRTITIPTIRRKLGLLPADAPAEPLTLPGMSRQPLTVGAGQ